MKNKSAVIVLIIGCVVAIAAMVMRARKDSPLRPVATLSPFMLTTQEGKSFSLEQMQGKVSLVNFIFTNCPGVCPMLTQQMAKVEKNSRDLGDKIQFVSISVDPENDTPAALKKYAEKYEANLSRWTFLTGPLDAIQKVVISGFKTAMGKAQKPGTEDPDMMEITHGEHFVLVDRGGQLRGFFTVKNDEEVNQIITSLRTLVAE